MKALNNLTGRDRTVLLVVVIAAAIVGAWLLIIQPKRSQASDLGNQLKVAQAQLTSAQQAVQAGLAAKNQYPSSYTELARLGEAVPADDNVPSMILQLQNAATTDHVDFRTLNVSGDSSSSSTATAATAQAVTATLPPGAAVGPAGFPIESFTFNFRGNFFHLSSFLGRVQHFVIVKNNNVTVSGRLLSFNAISLGAGPQGFPQISATISATAYLIPASQTVMGGGSPSGPSSSGSTSENTSTSSTGSNTPAAVATPIR